MEGGLDVVVGVEEKKVALLLDELEACKGGGLDCVALMGFVIEDVVSTSGDAELISSLAAPEGVIT